ncbi:hypothetical protein JCM30237_20540 [Halolamina litorea]|uniref:DUF7310 domain-containing protein n=1 Tax=Halolamina litorea TaxID=1515593 RepID=A0ABD6BPQ1_9EURY|nr:hypothetical protein [Halolamina litorea]
MVDSEDLERRLAAVERALGDGDDGAVGDNDIDAVSRGHDVDGRLDTLETRVEELDAALQAVRGFLGGVSAVNESVERRADAAVAAVDRLETEIHGDTEGSIEERFGEDSDERATANEYGCDRSSDRESVDDGGTESASNHGLRERLRGLR